jgi:peptidyl-prolyl cis-trans isomerase A (cyclophilin A)
MRLAAVATLAALYACFLLGCAASRPGTAANSTGAGRASTRGDPERTMLVRMDTSEGSITLELDPERAPLTVANFLKFTDAGAYNGTIFHRVVPHWVVQGGGWTPDLKERAKQAAAEGHPDIPVQNEWQNGLKNVRGSIGMARDEGPDTATREFYINLEDHPKLDAAREKTGNAGYAVFGRVVKGMGVIDTIAAIPTHPVPVAGVTDGSMDNVPVTPVVITKLERTK